MPASSADSSPPPFDVYSVAPSSPETSPPPDDDEEPPSLQDLDVDVRFKQLEIVLEKSAVYARILKEQMEKHKAIQLTSSPSPSSPKKVLKGRKRVVEQDESSNKRPKLEDIEGQTILFEQPELITGAKLKPYQLEGLQWMIALHQNGISGILADEMGLGKTLQTIAFSAYLRKVAPKPFLVVCPLSVLHNWVEEYKKFAPDIPVCMYHGTPTERAHLRNTVMSHSVARVSTSAKPATKGKKPKGRGGRKKGSKRAMTPPPAEDGLRTYTPGEEEELAKFPVIVTTYEMIINDRVHLEKYGWGYIVVDEGHRLKNMDCRLMQEIKRYSSAGRMVLTGTPLHNNLAELWSLLNFVLPDIFGDIDTFQHWFNLPEMQSNLGSDRSSEIIHQLHSILKPFILRRLKVDVTDLPPKKEYVLFAPLSVRQRELYDAILNGDIREYLTLQQKGAVKKAKKVVEVDVDAPRKLRKSRRAEYKVDGDDDEYFKKLERGDIDDRGRPKKTQDEQDEEEAEANKEYHQKAAMKKVNNMKLQNTIMQLRKVCSHPYLFDWPHDPATLQPILDSQLVDCSGKLLVLDRLLTVLFERKHKVLLFSQFKSMLDILEDWAVEFKGWNICRIDGSTGPAERRDEMNRFQRGGDSPDAPILFLLSTRAGGLGINLTAADTVIFYDQDWNPQMDAQAQDRAHRIGQTKPVLIFRLVTDHTIETKILDRAGDKKRLEAIVIAKGKFKAPTITGTGGKKETMAELAASLLKLEGEKITVVEDTKDVIADEDLDRLLDRSPEVFVDRGVGWTSSNATSSRAVKSAVFAVYEPPTDEGNEALAGMLGEDLV